MCDQCGYSGPDPATCLEARDQLFYRTLALPRPPFVHQLVVDAYGAQHLSDQSPKIAKLFTLMGLCMVAERDATGYEVQMAHMAMSRSRARGDWPDLAIGARTFSFNIGNVPEAQDLEAAIERGILQTWAAYTDLHADVRRFCDAVPR